MAGEITLRFYAELNDNLPPERRKRDFTHPLTREITLGDLIKELGVALEQVDLVLVNGEPSDFSRLVHDGDRISAYPVIEAFDITPISLIRPQPLRRTRFLLERGLKRLGEQLTHLGFDTRVEETRTPAHLAIVAEQERRILLTIEEVNFREIGISRGYRIVSTTPRRQLLEVLLHFDLQEALKKTRRSRT